MLSDCEVRGDAQVGGRLSAFAKRAKKLPISCTFQWIRVKEGVRNHSSLTTKHLSLNTHEMPNLLQCGVLLAYVQCAHAHHAKQKLF